MICFSSLLKITKNLGKFSFALKVNVVGCVSSSEDSNARNRFREAMVINVWFDSYAPHPPWSPTRGRLTEMDLLFLTSRLHCYYTLCQDQSLQLGLMLRWLPTYSSKFPMKKFMNSSVHPPNHSLRSGFRQSPNTSPPIVPSAAAHWNSLKVRGIREKKKPGWYHKDTYERERS